MLGTIERIFENKTQKGKRYWVLKINGKRYSVFDRGIVENVSEGQLVDFLYRTDGNYRTITSLENANSSARTLQRQKSQHIARMSCLKNAIELLSGYKMKIDERVGLTLEIAHRFEEELFRGREFDERRN